jgi:high-affinity Fe2+/Pb2+ permease
MAGRRRSAARAPAVAVAAALASVLVAFLLDRGSSGTRDAALLLGSLAIYVLLPLAVLWLVVALVRSRRR